MIIILTNYVSSFPPFQNGHLRYTCIAKKNYVYQWQIQTRNKELLKNEWGGGGGGGVNKRRVNKREGVGVVFEE